MLQRAADMENKPWATLEGGPLTATLIKTGGHFYNYNTCNLTHLGGKLRNVGKKKKVPHHELICPGLTVTSSSDA